MKYFFLVVVSISTLLSFSQERLFHNDEKLTEELEIIENLIHQKIDSLRAKKKLNSLNNNEYLYKAALLHADWMNEKGKLSHVQNKSKTKTPQKRVAFVGGDDSFVGENIAYTLFNIEMTNKKGKLYINQSYDEIANDLVQMWRYSKGHYKNIITKDYTTSGIALAVDFQENKIYAVQVFGGE